MFNAVSETAVITLKSRVIESEGDRPIIKDTMGKVCYERLLGQLDDDVRKRIINKKTSPVLTRHIAIRSRKYDTYALDFLRDHPEGLIVSLGAGLDTRFWRLNLKPEQYIELDLPEMMEVKTALLGDQIAYRTIAGSVLEEAWMDQVAAVSSSQVMFIAEGLLMYLHEEDVKRLLYKIAERFTESSLVLEVVNKKYTKGLNKKMVEMKMKQQLKSDAGSSYNFGLSDSNEIEDFHPKLHLADEWSYFEDPDIGSKVLSWLGKFKMFSRTQWTIRADIK